MKKKIIIGAIVVIVLGVVLVLVFSSGKQGNVVSPPSGINATGTAPVIATSGPIVAEPTGDTIDIGTPGGTVTMNNFYKHAVDVSQDQTSITIVQTDSYIVNYYRPDSSFALGIIKGPLAATQAQAEQAFLDATGISKADACKLSVRIGIPYWVDPNAAGGNVGLSFCKAGAFGQ